MISNILYAVCVGFLLVLYMRKAWTNAEFYSSVAQMEPLLETQKQIIEALDKYLMEEEKRIAVLKSHLRVYKVGHEKAMEDIPDLLGNPINAFMLIKRLTTDLEDIGYYIRMGTTNSKNTLSVSLEGVKFPTLEDLAGAVKALTRLQTTYRLDVRDLAEGVLNGIQGDPMTAADDKERNRDVKGALEWTKILLELDPDNPQAHVNMLHFEKTITEQDKRMEKKKTSDMQGEQYEIKHSNVMKTYNRNNYEALCRGEVEIPGEIAKRLSCRYLTVHHPFLRLAPIKVEQVYIKPDVYVFHEVISDEEIESIKNISLPKLQRSIVQDPDTGKRTKVFYRVSQSAWLDSSENVAIARLSTRVADMTGLSMQSAEMLQVVNYGVGGQFEPHYDHGQDYTKMFNDGMGNRIATVMFYMSDVALGGATVFTELGLSVFPIKHAALFWLNLLPSGEGDVATLHAGCPVLRGSKWVANKWIRQVGQEFLKPCSLNYQEERIRTISRGMPKMSR